MGTDQDLRQRRRVIVTAVVLAVAAIASVVAVSFSTTDDGSSTTTTVPPETGLAPVATTLVPSGPGLASELFAGVWPFASQGQVDAYRSDPGVGMFFDAEATAIEFARVYLAMPEPVSVAPVAVEAGGSTGTVAIRARARSPMITRVQVRRFGSDGPYAVVGTEADNIRVDQPAVAQSVGRTVALAGRSRAFEGTVDVEVRQDGQVRGEHLGRAFVTGGGGEALGPFTGSVPIDPPTEPAGAVVFATASAEDGAIQEATVVRVAFGGIGAASGRVRFAVFFHRGEELVRIEREVGPTVAVLRSALTSLFRGPSPSDGPGVSSLFSAGTADLFAGVVLRGDGTAVVDLSGEIPNASTSAGSRFLLEELGATVLQFPTVARVEYRLRGSCDEFWKWLQVGDCRIVERPR